MRSKLSLAVCLSMLLVSAAGAQEEDALLLSSEDAESPLHAPGSGRRSAVGLPATDEGAESPLEAPFWLARAFRSARGDEAALSSLAAESAASFALGQPGLSFRYVQTFGVTEEPYPETSAHFHYVEGIGTMGNAVWIGDHLGSRVLKFNATGGFIRQIGKAGVIDATGRSLSRVTDVAEDSSGNAWVVDAGSVSVVKFNAAGQPTAVLGQPWQPGSTNDRFNDPYSIAIDGAGNVYVSDTGYWGGYGNNRVQIFNSSGTYLATIGGTCGTGNTQLCQPRGLAVFGNRLYVADAGNHRVQIFNITTPASPSYVGTLGQTGVSGSGNNQFNWPHGVAVDTNYIYVADTGNHRVQVFDRSSLDYVATIGTGFGSSDAQFKYPTDVAVDAAGNIYVADFGNLRVQQFNSSRAYQRTYGTTGVPYPAANNRFNNPEGVAVGPDGSLYIVEGKGHRLVKLDANGVPQWAVGTAGLQGDRDDQFAYLSDVAVSPEGRIFTAAQWGRVRWMPAGSHRIQIFNPDGSFYGAFGGYGSGSYQFIAPTGLAFDAQGNLYVADSENHRVQIYDRHLAYVATLGITGTAGSGNNQFNRPYDVAVDRDGNIYVADEGNDRIQVFNSNRQYVRTIGGGGTGDAFNRFGSWGPHCVAVDSQGRLYVADTGNRRVQVFDTFANNNAYLTTLGGSSGRQPGRFRHAVGVAVGPDDSVYVSETINNHRIQKFVPGVPGWRQVNINGFGDRARSVSTLASIGDHLYAGTWSNANRAELWRMDANGNWSRIISAGLNISSNIGVNHVITYGGRLYVSFFNQNPPGQRQGYGAQIWRSADAITWQQVVSSGFGTPTNGEIFYMTVYSDAIYAVTWSYTDTHGAEIWRSATGDVGSWTQVSSNGFGDWCNFGVTVMQPVGGQLYAGTRSYIGGACASGADLWRYDGVSWSPVVTDGFGYSGTYEIGALAEFQGYLYAGVGRFDLSTNQYPGGEVWRCHIATTGCDAPADWTRVVTNGLNTPNNISVSLLEPAGAYLYAVAYNFQEGLSVWRTQNGTVWEVVAQGGFGDSNNYSTVWDKGLTVFNGRIYIGTFNPAHGGEVWQKTVTADFVASPRLGSPGTVVTFTNLAGGDMLTSTWNFGDGSAPLVVNHTNPVAHTYAAPGVYTVTLTVEDGVETAVRQRARYIDIAHRAFVPRVARNHNPLIALYDDFEYAGFNGHFNPVKWQFWGDAAYFSMQQQGGVMRLTRIGNPSTQLSTRLVASSPLYRTLRQVQRLQAKMRLSADTSGWAPSIQVMAANIGTPVRTWWATCELTTNQFRCWVTNSLQSQSEWGVISNQSVSPNQWHEARIEIDPGTAQVCVYHNNVLLGCHVPRDANLLKAATTFLARIGARTSTTNSAGALEFDDVYLTPVNP
ncbi:MAG: PKD domain-containing protein [Anaerolineae bacterium]|nr:PKD domain-containing protein [Anaerolineae bacterium]